MFGFKPKRFFRMLELSRPGTNKREVVRSVWMKNSKEVLAIISSHGWRHCCRQHSDSQGLSAKRQDEMKGGRLSLLDIY